MPRPEDSFREGAARNSARPGAPSSSRQETPVNAALGAARELKTAQGRRKQRRYLLEGVRLIEDALDQGLEPELFFLTPHLVETTMRGSRLATRVREGQAPVLDLNERLLRLISDTETPPGIIAVATIPEPLDQLPDPWTSGLCAVLLDQVRDPGNVGGIMRTAAASGIDLLVTTEASVDLYSPKVVRAGAGAHLRIELAPGRPVEEVADWLDHWPQVVLADGRADRTLYDVDWRRPSLLIVSNEAFGSNEWLREMRVARASIPMRSETESLNVAAAAAIFMYEARRPFFVAPGGRGYSYPHSAPRQRS